MPSLNLGGPVCRLGSQLGAGGGKGGVLLPGEADAAGA